MASEVRVVIADDEPLARRALHDHVRVVDWIGEIHEAPDGPEAIRLVDSVHPDLLFLDVMMPGNTGLEVAQRITHQPLIIFTTAFDRYAVTAFEIGALDYLLKPFGRERVLGVLARARAAMEHGLDPSGARAAHLLRGPGPLAELFVKERGRILRIPLDRVQRLEACDDYVAVHSEGRRHLLHARLRDLHERLDPRRFLRIHRSHVVNLDFVESLQPGDGARTVVVLRGRDRVTASRAGSALLREAMRTR